MRYKEEFFHTESCEAVQQVVPRGCSCPIPEVGCSEQPYLVGSVHAYGLGLELDGFKVPSNTNFSVILRFYDS